MNKIIAFIEDYSSLPSFMGFDFNMTCYPGDLICRALKKDINEITESGNTAFHLASQHGQFSHVKHLLMQGARTDIKNNEGKYACDYLPDNTHSGVKKWMDPNQSPSKDLRRYKVHKFIEIDPSPIYIEQVITSCSKYIDVKNEKRQTVFHLVVKKETYRPYQVQKLMIGWLIDVKVNINLQDDLGNTGLHYLIDNVPEMDLSFLDNIDPDERLKHLLMEKQGWFQSVNLLILNGMNLNCKNNQGDTVLHILAKKVTLLDNEQIESVTKMIELLVNNGANVRLKNKEGNLPEYYLREKAPDEIKELLRCAPLKSIFVKPSSKKSKIRRANQKQVRFRQT